MNDLGVNVGFNNDVEAQMQFNSIVQLLIDGYLRKKDKPKMADIMKSQNKVEEKGVLTEEHVKLIQQMIQEEASAVGENISDEVRKSGAEYIPGKLSNIERQFLYILVDNMLGVLDIVREKQMQNK